MAEWIKVEKATPDKPEVLRMAETLELHPDEVVGKLVRVWSWFDSQSLDGHAGSVTGVTLYKFLNRLVGRDGFAETMQSVGWLNDQGMPNFDYHTGEGAKKRALTARRQQKHRNASVTQSELPDKRREDKKETTRGFDLPDWVPEAEWSAFVEMRAKLKSPLTNRSKTLALGKLAELRAQGHDPRAVIDEAVLKGWKSFYAPKASPQTDEPWKGAH